jgi:hypothetical protein
MPLPAIGLRTSVEEDNHDETSYGRITTQGSGDNVQNVIAPTDPQVVYVPSYDAALNIASGSSSEQMS